MENVIFLIEKYKNDNSEKEKSENDDPGKGKSEKGQFRTWLILKRRICKKCEKGQSWTGIIWKRKMRAGASEKGQFWKGELEQRTIMKMEKSENDGSGKE